MILDRWSDREHLIPVEARARLVRPEDVADRKRVRGRRHAGHVESGDIVGVSQYGGELAGEEIEFVLGQVEARQAGDMRDVLTSDPVSHHTIVWEFRNLEHFLLTDELSFDRVAALPR